MTSSSSRHTRRLGRAGAAVAVLAATTVGFAGTASADTSAAHRSATAPQVISTVTNAYGTLTVVKNPAAVHPDSASGCTGSDPQVCFTISGSGQYVNYMEVDVKPSNTTTLTELIKYAPNSHVEETDTFHAEGGTTYGLDWTPAAYVTLGSYCGGAIINNSGTYACQTVSN